MNTRKIAIMLSLVAVLLAGTVLTAAAATPMQVSGFSLALVNGQAQASLHVQDALSQPIARAKVQISFEKDGSATIYRTRRTDASGNVSFAASLPAGTWVVCVEEIHKRGFSYDPTSNLCSSISIP